MKKIAAVSFLNARPITYGLEHGLGDDRFELSFELPSRCAELLERGEVDLGLIPSASYAAASGELRIVPGIAIAGFGPVRTVLLVGEVPWAEMTGDRARRRLAQLGDAAAAAVPASAASRRASARSPHDEVLDAASGTTGALVIGDAGFARRRALPARRRSRRRLARADRPALRLRGAGRAAPARSAPTTSRCCSESLRAGAGGARRRSRAPGPRRTAAIRADYERYLDRRHPLPAGRRGAVRPVGVLRSRARRRAAPARRSARGCSRRRARIAAPRRRGAPSRSIDALLADAAAGRAPVARRRASPLRRGADAGAGRRRRRAPPGAAPRRRGHLHHRSQRQLHERLRHPLQVLQLLPAAHQQDRRLRADARGAHAEVPGDGRPGRRADPAAGRAEPEAADRLVRGSVPLDEGELPARDPRPVARGDPLHRRDREHVDPPGDRAADRRRPRFDPGRRRRDPRRRDPLPDLAAQVLDRHLAGRHARGARAGPAHDRDDGVRLRRAAAPHRQPPRTPARAAGRDRRLHRVHLLAVPGRGDAPQAARRHDGDALPARVRAVAPLPRQLPQPAGVVADDGPRGRPGRACASAATTSARR